MTKTEQIHFRATKEWKKDIEKTAKKDKKYIGQVLEEGYELYKQNKSK